MTSKAKRPVFLEDDGLASVSDMESPGYCGKIAVFSARNGGRSSSFRVFSPRSPGVSSSSSSSSSLKPFPAVFYDARCDQNRHFLDSCHLCKKPISELHDIYMYRGDIPFCSEACRQEQIEMDEAEGKNRSLSMKASARKDAQKSTSTHGGKQRVHVRTGTVVAG